VRISDEQSAMVSGIVMSLRGLRVVIGREQLSLLIMGGTRALTTIGHLIIFLILLEIGWKVCTHVRWTPVKSFLNQTTHSKDMPKNPNALYMSIIG